MFYYLHLPETWIPNLIEKNSFRKPPQNVDAFLIDVNEFALSQIIIQLSNRYIILS